MFSISFESQGWWWRLNKGVWGTAKQGLSKERKNVKQTLNQLQLHQTRLYPIQHKNTVSMISDLITGCLYKINSSDLSEPGTDNCESPVAGQRPVVQCHGRGNFNMQKWGSHHQLISWCLGLLVPVTVPGTKGKFDGVRPCWFQAGVWN